MNKVDKNHVVATNAWEVYELPKTDCNNVAQPINLMIAIKIEVVKLESFKSIIML